MDINEKQNGSFRVPITTAATPTAVAIGSAQFAMRQPVTQNNSIVVEIYASSAKPSVSDSLGNAYQQIGGDVQIAPATTLNSLFLCVASKGGANTLTVSAPGAGVVFREVNAPGVSPNDVPTIVSLVQKLVTAARA